MTQKKKTDDSTYQMIREALTDPSKSVALESALDGMVSDLTQKFRSAMDVPQMSNDPHPVSDLEDIVIDRLFPVAKKRSESVQSEPASPPASDDGEPIVEPKDPDPIDPTVRPKESIKTTWNSEQMAPSAQPASSMSEGLFAAPQKNRLSQSIPNPQSKMSAHADQDLKKDSEKIAEDSQAVEPVLDALQDNVPDAVPDQSKQKSGEALEKQFKKRQQSLNDYLDGSHGSVSSHSV